MSNHEKIKSDIVARLRQGGRVLISAHLSPDGDSIGSQLAMYDLCKGLGCDPVIVNHDTAYPKYAFLSKHKLVNVYQDYDKNARFDFAVLLEAPDLERIGDVRKLLADNCYLINIDHHQGNQQYGALNYVDESFEAVGIMVLELFELAGVSPSRDNADELFTCVLTDTGRFRFSNTTPRALEVAAKLLRFGAHPKKISDALFACFSENQMRMMGELIAKMEIYHDGRTCMMISDQAMRSRYSKSSDEIEGLADYSIYPCGVQVGALLRELEPGRTKISLRSHDAFDVAAVAKVHGGGGHKNAAGCNIYEPLNVAKATLLAQIEKSLMP